MSDPFLLSSTRLDDDNNCAVCGRRAAVRKPSWATAYCTECFLQFRQDRWVEGNSKRDNT